MNLPDELHRGDSQWNTGFSHRGWHLPCLAGFRVAACDVYLVNPLLLQVCNFCRKKGATVGCEERACRRSYHFFCALCDDAAVETDQVNGVYRYLTEFFWLSLPAPGGCQQEGLHCVGFKGFLGKEISSPLSKWCLILCGRNVFISQENFTAVGGNLFSVWTCNTPERSLGQNWESQSLLAL